MRFTILAAALAICATTAHAQSPSFGIKAGLNTSFFSGDNSGDLDAKLGAVGGLTARYDLNPGLGVGAEVLYSQKGARDAERDRTLSFDYIEIPAYVRLAVPIGQTLDGGVTLGGYAGIPVRTSVSGSDTDIDAETDFGALVGIDLGSGPFYVEGRYSLGLADVTDSNELRSFLPIGSGSDPDLKNQSVSFTFGVRFGGAGRY